MKRRPHRSIRLLTHVHQACLVPFPLQITRIPLGVRTGRQDFDRLRVTLVVDLLRMSEAVCCVLDAATETEAVSLDIIQLLVFYEEDGRPCAKSKP